MQIETDVLMRNLTRAQELLSDKLAERARISIGAPEATVEGAEKPVMRAVVRVIRGVVQAKDVRKRIVVDFCAFEGVGYVSSEAGLCVRVIPVRCICSND
jgi:hypothetical protein